MPLSCSFVEAPAPPFLALSLPLTLPASASRAFRSEREVLQAKLMEVEGQLADARADRRENHRERRMAEAVDSMRRLFPGEGLKGAGVWGGQSKAGARCLHAPPVPR